MFDCDVVIIGGGPAGLTAGLYLCRANLRTVLLDKEGFGGYIKNIDLVENYPGFSEGISGAQLAAEMTTQATKFGLQLKRAEVMSIELFSSSRWVTCSNGMGYTTGAIIIAGGSKLKKLGIPGEEKLEGKGVFSCAMCDGGEFYDRVVVVFGGGDAGVTEALYMTKLASRVILIEMLPELTATAILQDRAKNNPKLEIRCGLKAEAIIGDTHVEAVELANIKTSQKETIKTDGVLVHIGLDPDTEYLDGIIPLDSQGQIIVNENMETEAPYVLAAGDIRSGSPRQIVSAVGDGAIAAISAQKLLQEML
jgi:thioredoxin reductase (NADPH)